MHRLSEVGIPLERVEGGGWTGQEHRHSKAESTDPKGLAGMLRGTGATLIRETVACRDRKQF